jgi:hypothetical protein
LGQRWFSTQCSRDAIPQICICGCSDQHSICNNQIRKTWVPIVALEPLIDSEVGSCIYVPITQDGKVVDSQRLRLNNHEVPSF